MTQDYLVRALAFNDEVRAFSVRTTNTVETARQKHDTWRVGTAALGRTITAGAMMGAAVGANGFLRVVKDIGMRDYFTGSTELHNGEIAEDFTYYFATSEQVPSAVGLGVLCTPEEVTEAAGGFIIQLMPGASEETISLLEERLANLTPISTLIDRGLSPEQVLEEVLGEDNIRILDQMPVEFKCNCGREKFLAAIKGLGEAEIVSMIEEDHGAEVECHFCREQYHYSEEDLRALITD